MSKLKCYYAHTMTSYNSTIEFEDISLLEELGFEVINPNKPEVNAGLQEFVNEHGWQKTMDYFKNIVNACDLIAFRSLPNGQILSGVAAEVQHAVKIGIPVIELPCSINKRCMDFPETKQYLIELGHYKVN